MLKYQLWDYKILLIEGKTLIFGPIYQMSEFELKILDEYLKVNLAKGFIRPSFLSEVQKALDPIGPVTHRRCGAGGSLVRASAIARSG